VPERFIASAEKGGLAGRCQVREPLRRAAVCGALRQLAFMLSRSSTAHRPAFTPVGEEAPWARLIPAEHWAVFCSAAKRLDEAGVEFLLAGAMALATHTGRWRNTKDIDVIVRRADRERAIAAIRADGFEDYHETQPYDRSWIFRGTKDGVIFDIIWELPNHRVAIDDEWFQHARGVQLCGRVYQAVSPEEMVRVKLYVMQRERCDWVDVLNVIAASVDRIDWDWLVNRMGPDLPLLHGALAVFNWLSPASARRLPAALRERFALPLIESEDPAAMERRRVALFDSRPWFALHQPLDRPLER
jgi:hypothetical protein